MHAVVSLEVDLNHTSDFFFFLSLCLLGNIFKETLPDFRMPLFKEGKKELLYFSEVAARDCMIAALKWPSGQVLEYMLATEKGMQDIGCH